MKSAALILGFEFSLYATRYTLLMSAPSLVKPQRRRPQLLLYLTPPALFIPAIHRRGPIQPALDLNEEQGSSLFPVIQNIFAVFHS